MKKRGLEPDSRTYTTMINAYAGVNHSGTMADYNPYIKPDNRTMQRIVGIYNESQQHISEQVAKLVQLQRPAQDPEPDIGLTGKVHLREEKRRENPTETVIDEKAVIEADISLGPSNAYLKVLNRYGMWSQMERIHLAMDQTGPLAPESITYATLFSGLLNRIAEQTEKRYTPALTSGLVVPREPLRLEEVGAAARSLWDSAVRQFYKDGYTPPESSSRRIGEEMALLAMQALLKGRPADERLAVALIPFLWNLPSPESVAVASAIQPSTPKLSNRTTSEEIPSFMRRIPPLPITIRSASSIVIMLSKAQKSNLASFYAQHFLSLPALQPQIDYSFLRSCIHSLSNTRDVQPIIDILDTYQPPVGNNGWPEYVYANALNASRWACDFPTALNIFRRYTHIPHGVEDGRPQDNWVKYQWSFPNGKPTDKLGMRWMKPLPQKPSAKIMSLLAKTAVSVKGHRAVEGNVRKYWNIFNGYSLEEFFVIPIEEQGSGGFRAEQEGEKEMIKRIDMMREGLGVRGDMKVDKYLGKALEWRVKLARDLVGICERLEEVEGPASGQGRKRRVGEVKEVMAGIIRSWGGDRRFRDDEHTREEDVDY
jgi:hypothetical protein